LKFQKAIGQVENTQAIGNLGRDIAMIETLIREKELGINLELKTKKIRVKKKSPAVKKTLGRKTNKKDDKKTKASSEIK
ncbi:MAG: 50S ribosomal protein L29, partial [Candidatus Humimicrobiaceae bacterium]